MSRCRWRCSPGHVWRALSKQLGCPTPASGGLGRADDHWLFTRTVWGGSSGWQWAIREPDLLLVTAMLALHGADGAIRFHTPSFSLGGGKCGSYQGDVCWGHGWEHPHHCCHSRSHLGLPSLTLPVPEQLLSGMDEAMGSREQCRKGGRWHRAGYLYF